MKLRLRAASLAIPLLVGACVVAVQPSFSAGAETTVLAISAPAQVGYTSAAAAPALRLWSECLTATNEARRAAGSSPLQLDTRVAMAATGHSTFQALTQKMSHAGTGGSNAGNRLTSVGYTWSAWGENVAIGQANCESVLAVWVASPPDRANILNPAFLHMGIGMVVDTSGVQYWTMDLAAGG